MPRASPSASSRVLTACEVIVPLAAPMVLVSEIPIDPLQIPRAPLPPAEREGAKVVLVIPARVRSASVPVRSAVSLDPSKPGGFELVRGEADTIWFDAPEGAVGPVGNRFLQPQVVKTQPGLIKP